MEVGKTLLLSTLRAWSAGKQPGHISRRPPMCPEAVSRAYWRVFPAFLCGPSFALVSGAVHCFPAVLSEADRGKAQHARGRELWLENLVQLPVFAQSLPRAGDVIICQQEHRRHCFSRCYQRSSQLRFYVAHACAPPTVFLPFLRLARTRTKRLKLGMSAGPVRLLLSC